MNIYEIFDATERAGMAGFFDYESDADSEREAKTAMLSTILDVDSDRIAFCLYILEVFEDPRSTFEELLNDAVAVLGGEKDEDDLTADYGMSWITDHALEEARRIEREEDEDY